MEQIFASIPTALNDLGRNDLVEEAVVLAAWKTTSGSGLNDRTKAISFAQKRLSIAVRDELWRRHLEELAPALIAALNGRLANGTVRFIDFQIDPKAFRDLSVDTSPPVVDVSEIPRSLRMAAESISDDTLRARFLDAAASRLLGKG